MNYTLFKTDKGYFYTDKQETQGCVCLESEEKDSYIVPIHFLQSFRLICSNDNLDYIANKCYTLNTFNDELIDLQEKCDRLKNILTKIELEK